MIIQGVAQWASLTEPNPMSGKYQLDLINLDDESVAKIKAAGVEVKYGSKGSKKESYGAYVTLKANKPVSVFNADKTPCVSKVGNGSVVACSVNPFEWNFKGKKGTSLGLRAVKVITLKEFGGSAVTELFDESASDVEELPF